MERALLEYLANALWQLPVLAGGAWMLLWLIKPDPRTQYRVWLAVLALGVLLPACGIRGGEIVPVPGAAFDELAMARIVQRSASVIAVEAPVALTASSGAGEERERARQAWRLPFRVQRVHLSARATHCVLGVYAGSVLLGLLRVVRAWRSARRLVESSREVALCSTADAVLKEFGRSLGVKLPQVRECAAVTSPMVVGALSPVVLLPEGFSEYAKNEVKAALLHELAHVKRRDYLVNGICQVAALPVGWHPVVYGVERRIRRTREMVCDEMAAREMDSEIGYARCLLTMARGMLRGGLSEQPEGVGLFSNNVLEERVMRLMETKTVVSVRTKLIRLGSGATAMAAATLMAASFHVVPTMAAERVASVPALQKNVPGATNASVPVIVLEASAQVPARPAVAPTAPAPATPDAVSEVAPVVWVAPKSMPPMAPAAPAPAAAPAAVAPVAPVPAPHAPPVAPVAPTAPSPRDQVAPVSPMNPTAPMNPTDEKKAPGSKHKNSSVYRTTRSDDGDEAVIVNGQVRGLTPEERERVQKAMATAAESVKKAMERFNSDDFRKQMAEVEGMAKFKAKAYLDSSEFKEQMEAAQRAMVEQRDLVNSAEFQAEMAKVPAMLEKLKAEYCANDVVKGAKEKEKQKNLKDPKVK